MLKFWAVVEIPGRLSSIFIVQRESIIMKAVGSVYQIQNDYSRQ
jgi:hypothetical protein